MHDTAPVLGRVTPPRNRQSAPVAIDVRHWFEEHTHRVMTNRLEDGSDLDVDQYVRHYIDLTTAKEAEPRILRMLLPIGRYYTTALLLSSSPSLGVNGGQNLRL